jgi:iron complex transport system ATP-binding protein
MEIFELVHQLVREGLAALVITHHINLAARYANRMILLSRGQVAAEGTPAKILVPAMLEQVFDWRLAVQTLPDGSPQILPLKPGDPGVS